MDKVLFQLFSSKKDSYKKRELHHINLGSHKCRVFEKKKE